MIVYGLLFFVIKIYHWTSAEETEDIDAEYVLNFDSALYVCGDEQSEGYFDSSQVEMTRYNETSTVMSGPIRFLQAFEHKTLVELYVEKEISGLYELVMSHELCDFCAELEKNEESNYYCYFKDIALPSSCPFEPADYIINNFTPQTQYLPLNKANEGRYQLTLNFFHNPSGDCTGVKQFIACVKVDVVIEPK